MKIRHGGNLQPGDFVIIASGTYTDMGWYIGQGRGTLQYYTVNVPQLMYKSFKEWQADPTKYPYRSQQFAKGFGAHCLWKAYVYGIGKITDPESIFTEQEDLENYRKSKEALISIKFPAK
jgi:hypothetical protein